MIRSSVPVAESAARALRAAACGDGRQAGHHRGVAQCREGVEGGHAHLLVLAAEEPCHRGGGGAVAALGEHAQQAHLARGIEAGEAAQEASRHLGPRHLLGETQSGGLDGGILVAKCLEDERRGLGCIHAGQP